ncbi:class I SAM-dependent methyltransferase [Rhizobium sp. XQZ8]|uniref:class I SAM-dependent methyltransferase n=1 Tax=Rhizobium populisoli TaxID=2859785 RepID=UPI001C668E2C|nr:class I SAM-dependent methyltransferase [Rhizobium populisoli]MBW6421148.1 class I SAM-dependent methyltransferase [Rhizobium populisoli]
MPEPARELAEDALYRDPLLAQFYDAANGWAADFDYCTGLARDARAILDLGCGTGELTAALSAGRDVVGVDPAAAMLEIAARRPGGERVEWVEADARTVRLDRRFDLVLLTGHAFQVFLTTEDQRAALATIAAHLAPGGRFIFDSRNPAYRSWENWTKRAGSREIEHPEHGRIEAWNESVYDEATDILTYENGFRVIATGQDLSASAQIRYTAKDALERLSGDAGLAVDIWLGDWEGNPFHTMAKEIIPIGRLA